MPNLHPQVARWGRDERQGVSVRTVRRTGPPLRRSGGAEGQAASVRGFRVGVPAQPDPQFRGAGPLANGTQPFSRLPDEEALLPLAGEGGAQRRMRGASAARSEENTYELTSIMRISNAVLCL